ncbi:MAG: DUF3685 domain-containing protein, partial [Oscillatoria sp. PMC 1076.18]|nr:DUF3685 domain-containing protein [Oscillatoria sp. PMC 1076.18]
MTDDKIKLILIDDDPIFRLGLATALSAFDDLEISSVVEQATQAVASISSLTPEKFPDVAILELSYLSFTTENNQVTSLFQQLKNTYPNLPVLLLSSSSNSELIAVARESGVDGYCPKGTKLSILVEGIRQLAAGKNFWTELESSSVTESESEVSVNSTGFKLLQTTEKKVKKSDLGAENSGEKLKPLPPPRWLYNLRKEGLKEIETNLLRVRNKTQNPKLSLLDTVFWRGRERELMFARWLVNQLLPIEVILEKETEEKPRKRNSLPNREIDKNQGGELLASSLSSYLTVTRTTQESVLNQLFANCLQKVNLGVNNHTNIPLEIDILQPEKKQELFYLILQNLSKLIEESQFLEIPSEKLSLRIPLILREIWQSSTIDFFSRYYLLPGESREYQIVDIVVKNASIISRDILEKIPLTLDLFSYLLYENQLVIDRVAYRSSSPEAMARGEILLDNLVIQIANAVMQVLLNYYGELETIKLSLYRRKFFSSRAIAQFRNNLSWRYRSEQLFEEPQAIFESKYRLFVLNNNHIQKIYIYSPRQTELEQLTGLRWAVTIALEARDAIAPRLRKVLGFVGGGVVYLLTQVIGRGIGLIGRGIIEG